MDRSQSSSPEDARAGHGRAADSLFRYFEEEIRSGALNEGDPLPPEREIVETHGVSRTVVREAVLALANKGLVNARPRHRPVVSKPSYDTALETVDAVVKRLLKQPRGVKNLFDTRTMIEAALVRLAATNAEMDDIAALKSALKSNAEAIEDSEQFYRTDTAFHAVLYQIPKNPILPVINKAYTSWLAPHWSRMPRLPDRNLKNYEAHASIYEAILMRDPNAAETALRLHLESAWNQVRETFGEL